MPKIGVLFSGFPQTFQDGMWTKFSDNGFLDGALNPSASNTYWKAYARGDLLAATPSRPARLRTLAHDLIATRGVCAVLAADTPAALAAIRERPGGWNGDLPVIAAFVGDPGAFSSLPHEADDPFGECGLPPRTFAFRDLPFDPEYDSVGVRTGVAVDLLLQNGVFTPHGSNLPRVGLLSNSSNPGLEREILTARSRAAAIRAGLVPGLPAVDFVLDVREVRCRSVSGGGVADYGLGAELTLTGTRANLKAFVTLEDPCLLDPNFVMAINNFTTTRGLANMWESLIPAREPGGFGCYGPDRERAFRLAAEKAIEACGEPGVARGQCESFPSDIYELLINQETYDQIAQIAGFTKTLSELRVLAGVPVKAFSGQGGS